MENTKIRQTVAEWVNKISGIDSDILIRIIDSFLVVLLLAVLSKVIIKIVKKRTTNNLLIYKWRKYVNYSVTIVGFALLFQIWVFEFTSMATFLGLFSAGLAIALKDPIINFFGWIFIKWRHPFTIGDRIQVGRFSGDVIDVRIFTFQLMEIGNWVEADQTTGRTISVPNLRVFTTELANYTSGFNFIWLEIPVVVTFESNWKIAKEILIKVVNDHTSHFIPRASAALNRASTQVVLPEENVNPQVFTSVEDIGVNLTIRFVCPPRERRSKTEEIWEHILDEFAARNDIDFAYPTIRYYDNKTEGKKY